LPKQLDYAIPKTSRKVLMSHLVESVEDNLVTRKFYAEIPPRVESSLTEKAKELAPIFEAMGKWAAYLADSD
jgi:DNA-binding HxlR family transcriptional regulator